MATDPADHLRAAADEFRELLAGAEPGLDPDLVAEAAQVAAISDYAASVMRRTPSLVADIAPHLGSTRSRAAFREAVAAACAAAASEEELKSALRRLRQREMLRLVWRHVCRLAGWRETTLEVSHLADACVDLAARWLAESLTARYGRPQSADGGELHLVVFGLGKLGARELNLSSDIDLVFAYPEAGMTTGGTREPETSESWFTRLARKLIATLGETTVDGFVFRVDMRLRPYGESGALVPSFQALESYWHAQGRDWERYAWVKARAVSDPGGQAPEVAEALRPFVFRRYIDFSAVAGLRDMKQRIDTQARKAGQRDDIKLGSGGIREVEFVAQAFQIIHGGRDPRLRRRALLPVLRTLAMKELLPADAVTSLIEGYGFLRDLEHSLQAVRDEQTHLLTSDPIDQFRVAKMLGLADWQAVVEALSRHRQSVSEVFTGVFRTEVEPSAADELRAAWEHPDDPSTFGSFSDPEAAAALVEGLRRAPAFSHMDPASRSRLDTFMPLLLADLAAHAATDDDVHDITALSRVLPVVAGVLRRSIYLVLLIENPGALRELVHLVSLSPWIADELARQPSLLDELIDPKSLYAEFDAPIAVAHRNRARVTLDRFAEVEEWLNALIHFKNAQVLKVAALEARHGLPLMRVSDHLSEIATTVLELVVDRAWDELEARHGAPAVAENQSGEFLVVAYGKLGSLETAYTSDLDLVFVHDSPENGNTTGERSVPNVTFHMRLAQRVISLLTTQTPSGNLFEIDVRLRPSGTDGMLVTSLAALARYQAEKAWTWEHQALVRARPVAGGTRIAQAFDSLRHDILTLRRDSDRLRDQVASMRERMRRANASRSDVLFRDAGGDRELPEDAVFHLKQDSGGIIDIEFIVQYLVLANAHQYPAMARWTDNFRILDTALDLGLIEAGHREALVDAFAAYRSRAHELSIRGGDPEVPAALWHGLRRGVYDVWTHVLGAAATDADVGTDLTDADRLGL